MSEYLKCFVVYINFNIGEEEIVFFSGVFIYSLLWFGNLIRLIG